jgi:hypothetical protein
MFAELGIEARFGQPKPLDRSAFDNVRLHDLLHISFGDVAIPDRVGVNHDVRPMLALIKATGLVRPHTSFQPAFGKLLLEEFL